MAADDNTALKAEIDRLRTSLAQKEKEAVRLKVDSLFLKTLYDGINEEIMVMDGGYTVLDVNRVFLSKHGLSREAVVGRKCHQVVNQRDEPCNARGQICPLERARTTGKRVEVTHQVKRKNGSTSEIIRLMYPLIVEDVATAQFVEISRDVTHYRHLIQKLQASERKFRAILDTASDAILSVDRDEKILVCNTAAQAMFGYSAREAIGKSFSLLFESQRAGDYRELMDLLKKGVSRRQGRLLALTGIKKDGEKFPVEMGISCFETRGVPTYTAIIRDVTVEKQMEKKLLQTERLAAVGQAVAHVAHELKNPLMIIGGFSQQLTKTLSDAKSRQKMEMILDEVERLEKLVRNVGDFTKQYKLVKRPADINGVIRDVLSLMGESPFSEKYTFTQALAEDLGETPCDPDRIRQVLMNLISNAMQAMEKGGAVSISTEKRSESVLIRITDQGIGMKENELLRIFEPFYTTRQKGAGLGLAISYKIVQAHGGDITAVSSPGQGTSFVITLPTH
jgi:two-component system, LuxR family, sensor kinase FixL